MRSVISTTTMMLVIGAAGAGAQSPDPAQAPAPAADAAPAQGRSSQLTLREGRYQIGQMERLLEGAVEHGASVIKDRLQALVPADMLLTENARARGFRLDGYGLFFDVEVPDLGGTLAWSFRTLDQNNLGVEAALQTLRAYVLQTAANDVNLQQALKRVELQVTPMAGLVQGQQQAAAAGGQGSDPQAVPASASSGVMPAAPPAVRPPVPADDPVLTDPDEAYRTEIREALMDAMLEHSRGLGVGAEEWLTVAARRTDARPRLGIDTDARTVVLSVKGSDLSAFLGGQLSAEQARQRIEVRVF